MPSDTPMSYTVNSRFGRSVFGLIALGAVAMFVFAAGLARAQTENLKPHYVVVTQDDSAIRCGPGEVWYSVSTLRAGDFVRVDGRVPGYRDVWLRVDYPGATPALVPAGEAKMVEGAGIVRLTTFSQLRAYNPSGGAASDSFQRLLKKNPLVAGTELSLVGSLTNTRNEVTAYLVQAPAEARCYLKEAFVRPASDEEVRAHFQKPALGEEEMTDASDGVDAALAHGTQEFAHTQTMTEANAQTPVHDQQAHQQEIARTPVQMLPPIAEDEWNTSDELLPEGQLADTQGREFVDDPVAAVHEFRPGPMSESLRERSSENVYEDYLDQLDNGASEASDELFESVATAEDDGTGFASFDEKAAQQRGPQQIQTQRSDRTQTARFDEDRPIATFEHLHAAFKTITAEPVEAAEIEPLIAEYRRLLASIPDTEEDVSLRKAVQARIELLDIRKELQQQMRKLAMIEESAQVDVVEIRTQIQGLRAHRDYVAVGRLATSSIYDGKRLPLMYRLQSIDDDTARTLAYVAPAEGVDLKGKLGAIVGVEGADHMDSALRLQVIAPTRVDRLTTIADASESEMDE